MQELFRYTQLQAENIANKRRAKIYESGLYGEVRGFPDEPGRFSLRRQTPRGHRRLLPRPGHSRRISRFPALLKNELKPFIL